MRPSLLRPLVHAAIALVLVACASAPRTPGDLPRGAWPADNDCLVSGVSKEAALWSYERLSGTEIPRGVLVMRRPGNAGHAAVVFEWGGERYVWDSTRGSVRTYARWDAPLTLAHTIAPDALSAQWLTPPVHVPPALPVPE